MITQIITLRKVCLTGVTAIMTLVISLPMAGAFEKLTVGQKAHIACKTTPVYSAPTVFSPMTGSKTFGDIVKITKLAAIFTLPESDYQSRKKLEQANARARKQGQTPKPITKADYHSASLGQNWHREICANILFGWCGLVQGSGHGDSLKKKLQQWLQPKPSGIFRRMKMATFAPCEALQGKLLGAKPILRRLTN